MPFRYWLWLLAVQAAWTGSYAGMKLAGAEMPAGLVVCLRYGLASLGLLMLVPRTGFPRIGGRDLFWIAVIGAFNFALAPMMQVVSLRYTQAIDVSILISLEPMFTVLVAALVLRERPGGRTVVALAVGALGMLLLSGAGFESVAPANTTRLWGNGLFVLSLFCEVAATIAGSNYKDRYSASHLILTMKFTGFLTAAAVYWPEIAGAPYAEFSWKAWGSVIYLAIFPSIFAYTSWFVILKKAPVHRVALSLFFQPLIGFAIGYTLLGESLSAGNVAGALLLCASLGWWQWRELRRRDRLTATAGA